MTTTTKLRNDYNDNYKDDDNNNHDDGEWNFKTEKMIIVKWIEKSEDK